MEGNQRDPLRGAIGKLTAAVRLWLNGGDVVDETDEALKAFGLVGEDPEAESFKVYRENWPAFNVFCATCRKWRRGHGKEMDYLDLIDWTEVRSVAELYGIRRSKWPELFSDMQVMINEATTILV